MALPAFQKKVQETYLVIFKKRLVNHMIMITMVLQVIGIEKHLNTVKISANRICCIDMYEIFAYFWLVIQYQALKSHFDDK